MRSIECKTPWLTVALLGLVSVSALAQVPVTPTEKQFPKPLPGAWMTVTERAYTSAIWYSP